LFIGENYVPWQEFINTVGRLFRQYAQDMAQILFRINVVQKASADKPIQQCTALAVEEHKVFISETDGTKGFFRGIMSASA
ncbi:MAG: hypothetical protein Q609_ECAC01296G0001, partial [Escherichia coli DORA_A_5_14_21]